MTNSADPTASLCRHRWVPARVARLSFLAGRGCGAREIAADALVGTTPSAVRRKAQRLGVTLRDAGGPHLPASVIGRLEAAASRRGLDRTTLIHRLLISAGSEDALIDNILDDL